MPIAQPVRRHTLWICLLALFAAGSAVAQSVTATLTTPTANYVAGGGTVTMTATINYAAQTLTTLGLNVTLPAGWSFASASGTNVPNVVPSAGTTAAAEFAYTSFPTNSASFSFVLNYAAGLTGDQTFPAVVQYKVSGNSTLQSLNLASVVIRQTAPVAPTITSAPTSQSIAPGGNVTLAVVADGTAPLTYQWQKNGVNVPGATSASLSLNGFQVADAGAYRVVVSNGWGTVTSSAAALGVLSAVKVIGGGFEFAANIVHPNGNVYDQVLLTGTAATITADPGQVTRISFIDLTDDIVQVEFSGAGTLTIVLANASGPATALKYNQPTVSYMKGHASLVIAGADESTNVSVFSVGAATAFNQSLFKAGEVYDGWADLGLISVASPTGKIAAIRAANVSFYATSGLTGINAPGVTVTPGPPAGPVFVGDISADGTATGTLLFAGASDVRITGGDCLQANNRAVQVDGITRINFTAGQRSDGTIFPAQTNRARFERNGVDVTAALVPPN